MTARYYICKDLIVQINTEAKSVIKALNLNEDRADRIINEVLKQYNKQEAIGKDLKFVLENYNNNELIFALAVLISATSISNEIVVYENKDKEGDSNE